jgi:hypothetical protein
MGSKSRQRGKSNELATAKFWGMRRHHFEAEDLHGHPILSVECKTRQTAIKTLDHWVTQAALAAPGGKIPIVHFHVLGRDRTEDLVIIRATDLREIIGKGEYK